MSTLPSINTHVSNSIFSPKKPQIPLPSNYIGNSNGNSPTNNRSSLSTIRLQQINSEKSFNPDYTQQYPILVQNNSKQISDPDSNINISKNISEDILNLALFTVEMSFAEYNAISIDKLLSHEYIQIVPNCWAINILVYYKKYNR
jgi:hypothetical protein